jgi:hypothetical protein
MEIALGGKWGVVDFGGILEPNLYRGRQVEKSPMEQDLRKRGYLLGTWWGRKMYL